MMMMMIPWVKKNKQRITCYKVSMVETFPNFRRRKRQTEAKENICPSNVSTGPSEVCTLTRQMLASALFTTDLEKRKVY